MEEDSRINMSVLLQFAKFSKGFQISDFEEFVQSIGVENLDLFGRLAYPNQWQLRFTNPEIREHWIRTARTRINNRSCWIYPLNQQEIRGFVHWLPNSVTNDQLVEQFKLYGEVLFVESQKQTVNDQSIEIDRRYYGLVLSHGMIKEDLPHFLKINGFLCLVVVRGRQPACFHCKEVGHRRVECHKYKAKLTDYCSRDPSTAPPRLKPRGKRHIRPERRTKSYLDSSGVSFPETETQTLGIFETLQQIQTKTSEDLQRRLKSFEKEITETLTRGILPVDTREQIQNKATGTIGICTNQGLEVNDEQLKKQRKEIQVSEETSALVKMSGEDHDMNTAKVETKGNGMQSALSAMHKDIIETIEKICKNAEEMEKDAETNESAAADPISVSDSRSVLLMLEKTKQTAVEILKDTFAETNESAAADPISASDSRSVLLMLEKTKQTAVEILEDTFKKLTEFTKRNDSTETRPKDAAAVDTDQNSIRDEMQSRLLMLEWAKQTATEYFENTVEKLKEEINSLSSKLTDDKTDGDKGLTKDEIQFACQMLAQAKETVEETLQSTFKKLEQEIAKVTEPDESSAEISIGSISPLKITSIAFPAKIKDVNYFSNEEMKVVAGAENIEKQVSTEQTREETAQTECVSATASPGIFKTPEISSQSEASEKATVSEKIVTESKRLELRVSKAAQEDIDKLQKNIAKIFDSVLAKAESELLPETRMILKQVESNVNQLTEKMKNRLKIDIEDVFASFKAGSFK